MTGAFGSLLYTNMAHSKTSVGIIGAGVAGLINAYVLLQDGFSDVTLISRDKSVGGTWARARIYPGLHINKYDDPSSNALTVSFEPIQHLVFTESIVSLLLKCLPQRMAASVSQALTSATIWRSSLISS